MNSSCELCKPCAHEENEYSLADEFECEQCDAIVCIQNRHVVDMEGLELCGRCAHEDE